MNDVDCYSRIEDVLLAMDKPPMNTQQNLVKIPIKCKQCEGSNPTALHGYVYKPRNVNDNDALSTGGEKKKVISGCTKLHAEEVSYCVVPVM